jgi:acetyl-CoA C-acetyltransferase
MGQALTAGTGQLPARQAAVAGGIPMSVPALTINKVCLSGIDSILLADQLIRAGSVEVIVAGGQESMTQAPHLLPKSRTGFKYGEVTMTDHLAHDGLRDFFTDQSSPWQPCDRHSGRPEPSPRATPRLSTTGRQPLWS